MHLQLKEANAEEHALEVLDECCTAFGGMYDSVKQRVQNRLDITSAH